MMQYKIKRTITFFAAMKRYPTVTHHDKMLLKKKDGTSYMTDSPALKQARSTIESALQSCKHLLPAKPIANPIRLDVTFCMLIEHDKYKEGMPHFKKPDRDNLLKTFKDVLCDFGFIKNDCQDFCGDVIKVWSEQSGVKVTITEYECI